MRSPAEHYQKELYPFQDGVLNLVKKLGLPFYLTGGTALGRGYFNHRYSDDLDLFVNNHPGYSDAVNRLHEALSRHEEYRLDAKSTVKAGHFTRFVCRSRRFSHVLLRVDLVNDIAAHFGAIRRHAVLGAIDSWRNILSNKISALYRQEPKDIADIWVIARNRPFSWKAVFGEAKEKDAGVDPLRAWETIASFPVEYMDRIKWARPIDRKAAARDILRIADDVLRGGRNSLVEKKNDRR